MTISCYLLYKRLLVETDTKKALPFWYGKRLKCLWAENYRHCHHLMAEPLPTLTKLRPNHLHPAILLVTLRGPDKPVALGVHTTVTGAVIWRLPVCTPGAFFWRQGNARIDNHGQRRPDNEQPRDRRPYRQAPFARYARHTLNAGRVGDKSRNGLSTKSTT